MDINRDIELPFSYSDRLVKILIIIVIVIVLAYVFDKLFRKKIVKMIHKPNVPKLKIKYEKRLENLYNKVQTNRIDVKNGYIELSNIVREFIEKATGIKVSSFSKNEAYKMGMEDLSLLMEECYPPEFAPKGTGDILNSINKSIGVIRKWNQKSH